MLRPLAQVREAYLQFMVSVATMLRADMNLPEDSYLVQEDMAQVLRLETQLANVSLARWWGRGRPWALAQPLVTAGSDPRPGAGHGPPGGEARRHRPVPQDGGGAAAEQVQPEGEAAPAPTAWMTKLVPSPRHQAPPMQVLRAHPGPACPVPAAPI